MHYHHQHLHSPSCLMIRPAFHPWVVPEQICRGCILRGGEGCKAGVASLRGDSTLTQEHSQLILHLGGYLSWQVHIHSFLNGPCLWSASYCAPAFICAVLLYRYVIPTALPGLRYKQPFPFFFSLDYFYPRPVLQSSSPCTCTNNSTGVTEGLPQGEEQVARAGDG